MTMTLRLIAIACLSCAAHRADASPSCPADAVSTTGGCVRGTHDDQLTVFRGIPYAAPPTGDRRWRAPAPPAGWQGVRDASAFGKSCPQGDKTIGGKLDTDEDCLFLNVWVPPHPKAKQPVMVWIHGGGFVQGGSALPVYDAEHLASQGDVIVVSINYRLGALGFLAHPALTAEDTQHHASGNYGLLDQIAALQWVASNIAAFGGDPHHVTIFGESAGGESVCALMASSLANGLFAGAVIESAQCVGGAAVPALHDTTGGEAQGTRIGDKLGCTGADAATCMRSKSVAEILNAAPAQAGFLGTGERFGLIVDGYALADRPGTLLDAGKLAHVPVLIGTNSDEGSLFTAMAGTKKLTVGSYVAQIAKRFPGNAKQIIAQYPPRTFGGANQAFDALVTDDVFTCPTRHAARTLHGPVYRYEFTHGSAASAARHAGATHGAEVPFVFGTGRSPTADERALSNTMIGYWAQFAHTGDPNVRGAPAWPVYDATRDSYLELDTTPRARDGLHAAACDMWDSLATP